MSEIQIGKVVDLGSKSRSVYTFPDFDKTYAGKLKAIDEKESNRVRKHIKTIKSRLLCLERRIEAGETPSTVDYIAEKKALEWLLERAGIKL